MNDFFNSNNFLVFDIETIPDIEGWRKLHNLPPEMSAQDVYEHAVKIRTEENKSNPEFFPHFLQKIVCLSRQNLMKKLFCRDFSKALIQNLF